MSVSRGRAKTSTGFRPMNAYNPIRAPDFSKEHWAWQQRVEKEILAAFQSREEHQRSSLHSRRDSYDEMMNTLSSFNKYPPVRTK